MVQYVLIPPLAIYSTCIMYHIHGYHKHDILTRNIQTRKRLQI